MAVPAQLCTVSNRAALSTDLMMWFTANRRDLPWRDTDDLYGTWISEIMLQQTTVKAVAPFWQRFMACFPDVASLAQADEQAVLSLWTGLGYYSRAVNLHRAARQICTERQGVLPDSYVGWLALPGVGPYAAGAIASLGLGEPVPALDANARRVLSRWSVNDHAAWAALKDSARRRLIDQLGTELVPADNPGAWNEALMELGALICRARYVACEICPVASYCNAARNGWAQVVPPPRRQVQAENVWVGLVVFTWRGQALLVPAQTGPLPGSWPGRSQARADFSSLHGGLWGLPTSPWLVGPDAAPIPWSGWRHSIDLPAGLWPAGTDGVCLGRFRHAITRYRLRVSVFQVTLDARVELPTQWFGGPDTSCGGGTHGQFFELGQGTPPLSSLAEKALHFHHDSVV